MVAAEADVDLPVTAAYHFAHLHVVERLPVDLHRVHEAGDVSGAADRDDAHLAGQVERRGVGAADGADVRQSDGAAEELVGPELGLVCEDFEVSDVALDLPDGLELDGLEVGRHQAVGGVDGDGDVVVVEDLELVGPVVGVVRVERGEVFEGDREGLDDEGKERDLVFAGLARVESFAQLGLGDLRVRAS